jgi:tRNA(Leu) C34 or U34 (ribose-2'-O)-methylase TrmL
MEPAMAGADHLMVRRFARGKRRRSARPYAWNLLTSPARCLPDFLIIGAQKAGTTSLFAHLNEHPAVWMAPWKECHFFSRPWLPTTAYRGFFLMRSTRRRIERRLGRRLLVGEATPYYLFHPLAPLRAARALPKAKLIVLLRDPVERAYSHYRHEVRLGLETLSFEEALDAEATRTAGETERLGRSPFASSDGHRHYTYIARGDTRSSCGGGSSASTGKRSTSSSQKRCSMTPVRVGADRAFPRAAGRRGRDVAAGGESRQGDGGDDGGDAAAPGGGVRWAESRSGGAAGRGVAVGEGVTSMRRFATILHDLRSPVNVGTIVRSHAAFGGEDLVFVGLRRQWGFGRKTQAFSRRLEKLCRITYLDDDDAFFRWCEDRRYTPVAIEIAEDAQPLQGARFPESPAIVVGGEGPGLSEALLERCAATYIIPQFGPVGCLNVGVSAVIAMYELTRRAATMREIRRNKFWVEPSDRVEMP